jgi:hypothetical protein
MLTFLHGQTPFWVLRPADRSGTADMQSRVDRTATPERTEGMLAIVAAVIFGLALVLDLADANLGDAFTPITLITAGLFCLALHLAGVGSGWNWRTRRRR